jgi:hypothetical protein
MRCLLQLSLGTMRAARDVQSGAAVFGLAAPVDAGLRGQLDAVWESIEEALKTGFRYGREKAEGLMEQAIAKAENLISEAGRKGAELHAVLLARIQTFLRTFVREAIGRIETQMTVGSGSFGLSTIRCSQKLVLSGSLKTNIAELFELASSGEIEISAEYAAPRAEVGAPR